MSSLKFGALLSLWLAASPASAAVAPIGARGDLGRKDVVLIKAASLTLLMRGTAPMSLNLTAPELASIHSLGERAQALIAVSAPGAAVPTTVPTAAPSLAAVRAVLGGRTPETLRNMPETEFTALAARWTSIWDLSSSGSRPRTPALSPNLWRRYVENWALYQPQRGGGLSAFSDANLSAYPPQEAARYRAAGAKIQETRFKTADGVTLYGWHVPAAPGKPTVINSHANAEHTGTLATVDIFTPFVEKGYGFFTFDYRGYGNSEGRPVEKGLYEDLRGASDHLSSLGIPTLSQIPFGRSLGGAVVAHVAAERPFKTVFLLGTFTSMRATAAVLKGMFSIPRFVPAQYLITQTFDTLRKIKRIASPLLIAHGDRDEMIPYKMGQLLFTAAVGAPKKEFLTIEGGDHNSIVYDQSQLLADALERFLGAAVPVSREALADLHASIDAMGRPWAHGTRTTYLPGILASGLGAVKPTNSYSPAKISVTDLSKPDGLLGAFAFATRNHTAGLVPDSHAVTGRDVVDRYADVNPFFIARWKRFLLRLIARRYEKVRGAVDGAPMLLLYDAEGFASDAAFVSRSIPSELGLTTPIPSDRLKIVLVPAALVDETAKAVPAGVRVLPLELLELEDLERVARP